MSKLSFRSADGHLGLGAIRLRGSRRSSPVTSPCFRPPTLWAPVRPVPSFEILGPCSFAWKANCTELSAVFFLCLVSSTLCCVEISSCFCLIDGSQPFFLAQMQVDPFLLFSITSVRVGRGKWEPDAFVLRP